jgi:hypothetical protein
MDETAAQTEGSFDSGDLRPAASTSESVDERSLVSQQIHLRPTLVSRLAFGLVMISCAAVFLAGAYWAVSGALAVVYAGCWAAIDRRRVVVDRDGVRARGVHRWVALAWDEIDRYTYWSGNASSHARRSLEIGAPGSSVVGTRHVLILYGKDGTRVRIDSRYRGAHVAIARILTVLHARLGENASFAPFSLDDEGLRHARRGLLPWKQLERVKLDNQLPPRLRVLERGRVLAWVSVRMSHVHNGILLLERLAERGVELDLGRKQRVTHRLAGLLDARAALPRAEVVRRG